MEISKKDIVKYSIKEKGYDQVDIILEDWEIGRSGRVTIISSVGEWSSSWGAMGGTIRDFLCRIDNDYFIKNLDGRPSYFDNEATFELIKKDIIAERLINCGESYRAKKFTNNPGGYTNWDKEDARQAMDDLNTFGIDNFNSYEGFAMAAVRSDDKWMELYDDPPCPPGVETHNPWLKKFLEERWPKFLNYLQSEKKAA